MDKNCVNNMLTRINVMSRNVNVNNVKAGSIVVAGTRNVHICSRATSTSNGREDYKGKGCRAIQPIPWISRDDKTHQGVAAQQLAVMSDIKPEVVIQV